MGVPASSLVYLERMGVFEKGISVFDLGVQNLVLVSENEIFDFMRKFNKDLSDQKLSVFAKQLEERGRLQYSKNSAFLYEVIEVIGCKYSTIDIIQRPNGVREDVDYIEADLNEYSVPESRKNHYDLVLNFGTTEHIFNQENCFRVCHDLLKPGGHIFHSVPSIFMDHGYYMYSPMLFSEMALANGYEVKDCFFTVGEQIPLLDSIRYNRDMIIRSSTDLKGINLPNLGFHFLAKKTNNQDFLLPNDASTPIGNVRINVIIPWTNTDENKHILRYRTRLLFNNPILFFKKAVKYLLERNWQRGR